MDDSDQLQYENKTL